MTKLRAGFLALLASLMFSTSALAETYAHSAPAVQGYDVVSYHTGKRPIRGNGHFVAVHDGATYLFANKDNLKRFNKNPEKYVPAYNGFCAFGVAVGKKFTGDPEVFRVVNGKTYLNLDAEIQDMWLEDTKGFIRKGDAKWNKVKQQAPAT